MDRIILLRSYSMSQRWLIFEVFKARLYVVTCRWYKLYNYNFRHNGCPKPNFVNKFLVEHFYNDLLLLLLSCSLNCV